MKALPLILLLTIIPLAFTSQVQAIPGYDPRWPHHLRIVEVSWITHDEFPESLVSKLDNYNLSKFSYILMNFTTEVWNPSAVSILAGSEDVYEKGSQLKVDSDTVTVDVADLLGCFDSHYPPTDPNDKTCSIQASYDHYVVKSGLSRFAGSVVVRFNQSGVLGWPEGNYSIYHWSGSSIPLYVVSNSSGVYQMPGEVPDGWGSTKGLGYGLTLSGALPLSSLAILYGPIFVIAAFVGWKLKKRKTTNGNP